MFPLSLALCQWWQGAHGHSCRGQQGINSLSQIVMALAHWTSRKPNAWLKTFPLHRLTEVPFCLRCTFFWPVCSCMLGLLCACLVTLLFLSLHSSLHRAKAMAAVLVKRFVYPIRMMKRPFISTLPPARRWQELYLDKPLKHTARHETAPGKEVRRQYTYSLTNTAAHTHKCAHTDSKLSKKRED